MSNIVYILGAGCARASSNQFEGISNPIDHSIGLLHLNLRIFIWKSQFMSFTCRLVISNIIVAIK